jgi:aminopeptidase YwaD
VIISKNPKAEKKIVICAHIDAVENTPGASDNASGVVVELLLAEMLKNYQGKLGFEIIAFNGEDHYSAGGQMDYLKRYKEQFKKILVVTNIDDVGYIKGKNAYSLYECPKQIQLKINQVFENYSNLLKGEKWFQGDHMIFVQKSIPAVAITSNRVVELMSNITHSPKDTPEIIDCDKLVELAFALKKLIIKINQDMTKTNDIS